MRISRIVIALAAIVAMAGVISCSHTHPPNALIVYLPDTNCPTTWDGDLIDNLWVWPGDTIVWVNSGANPKHVKLVTGSPIVTTTDFTVPVRGRKVTVILGSATGSTSVEINGAPCGASGGPKVNVGDPP